MDIIKVEYRNNLYISPVKLQIPGWSGEPTQDSPQPWHLKPYVDGCTAGLEVKFMYNETREIVEEKDISLPFVHINEKFYALKTDIDIHYENHNILLLPHPRFYTDENCPLVLQTQIENFWGKGMLIYFRYHGKSIFSFGSPIAQIIFMQQNIEYSFCQMTKEKIKKRESFEKNINGDTNGNFYKTASILDKKGLLDKYLEESKIRQESSIVSRRKKMKRRLVVRKNKIEKI